MAGLQIALLGQFQVTRDGVPVRGFRSRRAEALLAYLAVEASRAHRREHLMALLWPEAPDAVARTNLRATLRNLRRAIGDTPAESDHQPAEAEAEAVSAAQSSPAVPTAPILLVTDNALQYNPAGDALLDVAVLRGALAATNSHTHADPTTCPACAERLASVITLYRGDFLAGFTLPETPAWEEWATVRREELHRQVVDALDALVAYHERRRELDRALEYARRQLELDPWREEAQRAVMRLLANQGDRAGALAAYETGRGVLAADLGLAPSAETAALAEQIRAGTFAVATAPRYTPPAPPNPLLGREATLATITALLTEPGTRLLTLLGPPGIGKTRLAQGVAAHLQESYADGACFVPLAALDDPARVPGAIAEALGLSETPGQPLRSRLTAFLRDKHLLLVLDNFEHLLEAGPLVSELLEAGPGVKVLTTSRAALRLSGEHEVVVPPLTLPAADLLATGVPDLEALAASTAVQLFVARARAIQADVALTEANAPTVAAITLRLEGVPLAIELAAARLRLFTPETLLARLTSSLEVLNGGPRDRDPRQQSLRGAIAWSHALLTPQEAALFRRLGVFVGGCTLDSIEAVCAGARSAQTAAPGANKQEPKIDVLTIVDALLSQSLLNARVGRDGQMRFGMLVAIQEYAREQLGASDDAGAVRQAHIAYFLALAEESFAHRSQSDPARIAWMDRLEDEQDNLRAALGWCLDTDAVEAALRLGGALWPFWLRCGHWEEGRHWLEQSLAALPTAATPPLASYQAEAHLGFASLMHALGEFEPAYEHAQQSRTLFAAAGQTAQLRRREAFALHMIGLIVRDQGDNTGSRRYLQEALVLQQQAGDTAALMYTIHNLGFSAFLAGDDEQAAALFERSLRMSRRGGERWTTFWNVLQLAGLRSRAGDQAAAQQLFEESLALATALRYQRGRALALDGLAYVALACRRLDAARALYEQSQRLSHAIQDAAQVVRSRLGQGWVSVYEGDPAAARRCFRDALEEAAALSMPLEVLRALVGLLSLEIAGREIARPAKAARLYGLIRAQPALLTQVMAEAPERRAYAEAEAILGKRLSTTARQQAVAEGQAMSLEDAVAFALA